MKRTTIAVLALSLAGLASYASAQGDDARPMNQLRAQGLVDVVPPPSAPEGASTVTMEPVEKGNPPVCTMSLQYTEHERHIIFVKWYKKLRGTAVVSCEGQPSVTLDVTGEGPELGLGIPNRGLIKAQHKVAAANIEVRVPFPFVPKSLEGTYVYGGVSFLGIGGIVSPWTNSGASFNVTILMPKSLNLSLLTYNITTIKMKLGR